MRKRKCCKSNGPGHTTICRHFKPEANKVDGLHVPASVRFAALDVRAKIYADREKKQAEQRAYKAANAV